MKYWSGINMEKENRWRLVDADEHCPDHEMGFDLNDIPCDKLFLS